MPTIAPTNSVPGTQTFNEDGILVFSSDNGNAIIVTDPDSASVTTVISIAEGRLDVDTIYGGGASVVGNGTQSLTIQGTAAQITEILDGLTYTPSEDDNGIRTLSITTVSDGVDVDAVQINITPVNDAPEIYGTTSVSFSEGSTYTFDSAHGGLRIHDVEGNDQIVTLIVDEGSMSVFGGGGAHITGNGSNVIIVQGSIDDVNDAIGTLTYVPSDSDFYGNVGIAVTAVDSGSPAGVDSHVIAVTIENVNDAPTLSGDREIEVDENGSYTITGADLNTDDIDDADEALTYTVVSTLVYGSLSVDGDTIGYGGTFTEDDIANGRVVYTQNGSEGSADTLSFVVQDDDNAYAGGLSSVTSAQLDIIINPVNDAPELLYYGGNGTDEEYVENGITKFFNHFSISDDDNDSLSGGSIVVYGFVSGEDSIGYSTYGGVSASTSLSGDQYTISFTGTASLGTYTNILNSFNYINLSDDPDTGTRDIVFSVSDGTDSDSLTIDLTITAVNDAPSITGDRTFTVDLDGDYILTEDDLFGFDVDSEDGDLMFTVVASAYGSISVEDGYGGYGGYGGNSFSLDDILNGAVRYVNDGTPGHLNDTLQVALSDGEASVIGTLGITVRQNPILTMDDTIGYTEQQGAVTIDSAIGLTDLDGDTITGAVISFVEDSDQETLAAGLSLPMHITSSYFNGDLVLSGMSTLADYITALQSVTYESNDDSPPESRDILVTVTDIAGLTAEQTVTIHFTAVNDVPVVVANNDIEIDEGDTVTIVGEDLQVTDADEPEAITYQLMNAPEYGSLYVDGSLLGYGGTFTQADIDEALVTYVHGGVGSTDESLDLFVTSGQDTLSLTLDITVNPVNDPTVIGIDDDAFVIIRNTTLNLNGNVELSDEDDSEVEITITASHGTFTVNTDSIYGGQITTGDGQNDSIFTAYGTITELNQMLATMSFTPTNGFTGAAELNFAVDDGDDMSYGTIDIRVNAANSGGGGGGGNPPPQPDTVTSSQTETLVGAQRDLILTGSADIDGYGNGISNHITGNAGNNHLFGLEGADTVIGGLGDDYGFGNTGNDFIYGNQGADSIFGGQDIDYAFGGQGDDVVYGNQGNDFIYGNLGDDVLYGGNGNDSVLGGQGDDMLFGNQGNDILVGNLGDDTLHGGAGSDTFVFTAGASATVLDYDTAEDQLFSLFALNGSFEDDGNGNAVYVDGDTTITIIGADAETVNLNIIQPMI